MTLGNAWIMLRRAQDQRATPNLLGFATQSLTVFILDLEAHFEHAKSFEVTILEDLHETVYGELQYAAEDLDGHHWLFSRHARDLNPERWGATVAHSAAIRPNISPILSVRNGQQAVEFYVAAFGEHVLFGLVHEPVGAVSQFYTAMHESIVLTHSP